MSERTMFVAGASGAVGKVVVQQALGRGDRVRAHYRKPPAEGLPPGAVVGDLGDAGWLVEQMRGATTVLQLIGTIRQRFARGDTYETSDIGTTRSLVEAAKAAGTVDHIVLLSSTGAGKPMGAYLKAKAAAEALMRGSGIAWTTLRPSAFDGDRHHAPPGLGLIARIPGLHHLRPIPVADLAAALVHVAEERAPLDTVLEGDALFAQVVR